MRSGSAGLQIRLIILRRLVSITYPVQGSNIFDGLLKQLINKEDHLLACTTRMFETQPLLVEISNALNPQTEVQKVKRLGC
jgi:hypothetical protein